MFFLGLFKKKNVIPVGLPLGFGGPIFYIPNFHFSLMPENIKMVFPKKIFLKWATFPRETGIF